MPQRFSPWPHRVAVLLCCATFPLIWLGGMVTTYDAGMAVPDWPTTYGYNLFAYPWKTWLFGPFDLFIEHGHRLLGATVGLLSIVFVALVFGCDRRRLARTGAVALFLLILGQGLLGGARVRLDERTLALAHACLGMATFAFAAAMAAMTSRYWVEHSGEKFADVRKAQRLIRFAVITAGAAYVQVVLGALLRHVPTGASPAFFRIAVFFHIGVGLMVLVHVILLGWRTLSGFRDQRLVVRPVIVALILVALQIALGASTWILKYGWPSLLSDLSIAVGFTVQANSLSQAMVTTAHVAVGALILSLCVVIALRSWRVLMFARTAAAETTHPKSAVTDSVRCGFEPGHAAALAGRSSFALLFSLTRPAVRN